MNFPSWYKLGDSSDGDHRIALATHRICRPEETFARYAPLCPQFGITRIANVTGLDSLGIPVYVAVRPASRALSVAQGKGVSADAARVSALMEAIEVWHAERIVGDIRYQSLASLEEEEPVLDIAKLPSILPLSREQPIAWIRGFDLLQGRSKWVPLEACSLDLTMPDEFFSRNTNGLASGNHPLEACIHALTELIERDAKAMHQGERHGSASERRRSVDQTGDPEVLGILARIADAGARCAVWDITSDARIPTFSACIYEPPGVGTRIPCFGSGTHLSAKIALVRALTEAAQVRLNLIAGSREDIVTRGRQYRPSDDDLVAWIEGIEGQAQASPIDLSEGESTGTLEGNLELILDRLRAMGIEEAVAVDLSRSDIGVPVVKILVPELVGPGSAHVRRSRA